MKWKRPENQEMAGYFTRYTDLITENDIIKVLKSAKTSTRAFLFGLKLDDWDHRHAEGKWSVKEVIVHILDTERIFAYRALRFARKDETALAGFDQDDYILPSKATERSIASIIQEYEAVREATITLLENLPEESHDFAGIASNNRMTVRAFAFAIAGHERHHLKGLKENYKLK